MRVERLELEVVQAIPASTSTTDPAILFIHGARHGAWCWQEYFLPYFASQGFAAWALSYRGHGASAGRASLADYTLNDYVNDATTVLADLPARPVLVGHSLGGAVVQHVVAAQGQQLRAAVLLASVPPDGVGLLDRLRTDLLKRRDKAQLVAYLQGQPVPFPHQIFFSPALDATDRERYVASIQPESPLIQRDIQRPIITKRPQSAPPMLVLGAGRDWFLSHGAVRRTARFYGTRPRFFRGMAHDMMLEPGWHAVADSIIAFLRTLP